jgi:hypothetical protein
LFSLDIVRRKPVGGGFGLARHEGEPVPNLFDGGHVFPMI